MFQFQHIEYLFALAVIPIMLVLYFLLLSWKKKAIKKIGDVNLVTQLIKTFSPKLFFLKFLLVVLAYTLCALALSDLVKPGATENDNRSGIDVIIALDVSN